MEENKNDILCGVNTFRKKEVKLRENLRTGSFGTVAGPILRDYYMAGSASGQNGPNRAVVIGYPSGQDGAILPARDYPLYPASKISPKAI